MHTTEHTSRNYDTKLDDIRMMVQRMGELVEEQLRLAIDALSKGDMALTQHVIGDNQRVNGMEVDIDEKCTQILACRQPAANDLRLVMTVVRIITDLERIGDQAKNIARMAQRLQQRQKLRDLPRYKEIKHAAKLVRDMLHKSLDAFVQLDLVSIPQIVRQDAQVDDEYRAILRILIAHMMEDPRTISIAIELLFIAKAIERAGDHAKNISEHLVCMVKGHNVRHVTAEEIEREILNSPPTD